MRSHALLLLPLLAAACAAPNHPIQDATVLVRTPQGTELGVSTDHGLVFLGTAGRSGEVEVTAWFQDGPNVERSVVEPVGGGIFTAEMEIRLPATPLSFDTPSVGDQVTVIGRDSDGLWELTADVAEDPRITGVLLEAKRELGTRPEHVGAGVYVGAGRDRALVGLISGRVRLTSEGRVREYVTVVGPAVLWRLVAFRRKVSPRKRWVYREDVL